MRRLWFWLFLSFQLAHRDNAQLPWLDLVVTILLTPTYVIPHQFISDSALWGVAKFKLRLKCCFTCRRAVNTIEFDRLSYFNVRYKKKKVLAILG